MTARVGDRAALERLLGVPEMAWLVQRVRGRLSAAGDGPLSGVVQLNAPTEAQRAAAVRLVGRPRRPGTALRVDLAAVEEVLRRGPWPAGLADAVVTLTGPVVDARAAREQEAAAWRRAEAGLAAVAGRLPGLAAWWDPWCAAGGLKRAARAEAARTGVPPGPSVAAALVEATAEVLTQLPAAGEPLAVLAQRVTGEAHGLDESRPLGRLAAAAVAAAFAPGEASPRRVWAAAGVVLSAVASTALCLGVPGVSPDGDHGPSRRTATATALEAMRAARTPLVLTLDQVRSGGVAALPPEATVHVCENPTVVEVVAERWAAGDGAPVLVCTSGQPSAAVVELLRALTAQGAGCRYHGDFDWAGLRIAAALRQRVPWTPWRYAAADYLALAREEVSRLRLAGPVAGSPWDPGLAVAMAERGIAVEEEAVADVLAADLVR